MYAVMQFFLIKMSCHNGNLGNQFECFLTLTILTIFDVYLAHLGENTTLSKTLSLTLSLHRRSTRMRHLAKETLFTKQTCCYSITVIISTFLTTAKPMSFHYEKTLSHSTNRFQSRNASENTA